MSLLESASAVFVPYSALAMQRGVHKSLLAMLVETHHLWSYPVQLQLRDRPRILVRLEQTRSVRWQTPGGPSCGHDIQP